MSNLDLDSAVHTPNIFSPLDSPSIMNSAIKQNSLTQSLIEHEDIVEALEKAIIESKNKIFVESNVQVKEIVQCDTSVLDFLKENKDTLEKIIKEQHIDVIEDSKTPPIESSKEVFALLEKVDAQLEKQNECSKKNNRLFMIGSVIATGVLGFITYSYLKKKE